MTEKTTLVVSDMTCSHCVGTVREALGRALPGTNVEIDLAAHTVSFTGSKATAEAAIREAGYTPEAG